MVEITDPVFGQMRYEHRWVKKESIFIFGKNQTVKICVKAFNAKPITDSQRSSYLKMKENLETILNECADKIYDYLNKFYNAKLEDASKVNEHVQCTHIIFMQNGDTIFLFDTYYDIENGIGIQIYPEIEIGPQDAFL